MGTLDKLNELFYDIPYEDVKRRFENGLGLDGPHSPNEPIDPSETGNTEREEVRVVRVIDGDTIVVRRNGKNETVRLLLVDTPELLQTGGDEPYAQEAKLFVENFLIDNAAFLSFDVEQTDRYGRTLAYVYNQNGESLQEALIRNGLARVYSVGQNTQNLRAYQALEVAAQASGQRIWSLPDYVSSTGFTHVQDTGSGITRERYLSTSLSQDEKQFNSEARQLGAKAQFKNSGFRRSTYTSFSGADITISIAFKGGEPVRIGEAQTVSYSLFRPMEPVYALGSAKPRGFVRGPRTIAGSIIFTVFDRNVLLDKFYKAYQKAKSTCTDKEYLTDELPPFDLHAIFTNEYGMQAQMVIHGIHVSSEGQVMSIEDMITENTIQYIATDITLMRPGVK